MKTSQDIVKVYSGSDKPSSMMVLGFINDEYQFLYHGKDIGWYILTRIKGFEKLETKDFTWCYLPDMDCAS